MSSLTEPPEGTLGGLELSLALISPSRNSLVFAVVCDWKKSLLKSLLRSRTELLPPIAQSFQSGTTRRLTKLPIIDLIGGQYFVRRTTAFISDDNGWQNSEGQSAGAPGHPFAFGASRSGTRCNSRDSATAPCCNTCVSS